MPSALRRPRAFSAAAAFLAALALTCAACGSTSASPPVHSKATGVAAQLPAAVRSRGVLRVATNASYAPNEFIAANGHTITGMGRRPGHGARAGPRPPGRVFQRVLRSADHRDRRGQVRHGDVLADRHQSPPARR